MRCGEIKRGADRTRKVIRVRGRLEIEALSKQGQNLAVSRRKQKSSARWPATNLVLVAGGLGLLGAIGTGVWFKKLGSKAVPVLAPPPGAATNPGPLATNSITPDPAAFLAWLTNQTESAELINMGTSLLEQNWAGQAVLCYRRALELKPTDEEAHFNLGVALARLGQIAEAEQAYREALSLFPEYVEAHNNLGNLLTRQRRYADAVTEFNAALKLAPEDASAHNNLGRAFAEQGVMAEAMQHFSEAARLDTNYVEARFNLGAACLSLGRTNEAITAFRETLRLRPDFAPAAQALEKLRRGFR